MSDRTTDRHVIWSNINLNLDDWRGNMREQLETNGTNPDEITEDMLYQEMVRVNDDYLYDERDNLNVQLTEPIIVIADLGRWNGRFLGYKMIESGKISDCLYSATDYTEWYVDKDGEFKAEAVHHDGRNKYMYRVFKDSSTEEQIVDLQDKIYSGTVTQADIDRVTRPLGKDIAKVYGFDLSKEKQSAEMER